MFVLLNELLVFRSDAPLPQIFRLLHQMPSSQQSAIDSHLDPADLAALSDIDSDDDDATLAVGVMGKAGDVGSLDRDRSPEPEAGTTCPKKLRTTVHKRRASGHIRLPIE